MNLEILQWIGLGLQFLLLANCYHLIWRGRGERPIYARFDPDRGVPIKGESATTGGSAVIAREDRTRDGM